MEPFIVEILEKGSQKERDKEIEETFNVARSVNILKIMIVSSILMKS